MKWLSYSYLTKCITAIVNSLISVKCSYQKINSCIKLVFQSHWDRLKVWREKNKRPKKKKTNQYETKNINSLSNNEDYSYSLEKEMLKTKWMTMKAIKN